jgi:signal transduction histidine kinase
LETRDGRHVEVEFISNVYQVGRKRTIQCNVRDISQRKVSEKSHIRIESQLKQAQKMAAVAALDGGIAHQFNNALMVINGGLSMLETIEKNQEMGEWLQLMSKAADHMSRLNMELLAYARGGKYGIEKVFLSDLVRDSVRLLKPKIKLPITIETDISPDLEPLHLNQSQMQMVLQAILTNALEAIETQGLIRITGRKAVMTDEHVKHFFGLAPGIYNTLKVVDKSETSASHKETISIGG